MDIRRWRPQIAYILSRMQRWAAARRRAAGKPAGKRERGAAQTRYFPGPAHSEELRAVPRPGAGAPNARKPCRSRPRRGSECTVLHGGGLVPPNVQRRLQAVAPDGGRSGRRER